MKMKENKISMKVKENKNWTKIKENNKLKLKIYFWMKENK